ncbi:MAG: hypothetical protein PVG89_15950 [Gammaproteobacteria bacterium]|jgi:hypothetical protein
MKKPNFLYAMVAMTSGILALPIMASVNMLLGLGMLALPVLLVYQASDA